jgi:GMP synthase (glutamine-hydrolysing)
MQDPIHGFRQDYGRGIVIKAVVVLDFGSQYSQLIVRRIRELGVYAELFPCDAAETSFAHLDPGAFILSGGPASVFEANAPALPPFLRSVNVPILGICYGMQLLAVAFGGEVKPASHGEFGAATFHPEGHELFSGLPDAIGVWMSHGDRVESIPSGFRAIGRTDCSPVAAMVDAQDRIYGLQFHPEVEHTPFGGEILRNFLYHIANLSASWTPVRFLESLTEEIRRKVGAQRVLCALSGGVDSTVTAFLLHKAIPEQGMCLFVDTGLLRSGEVQEVEQTLSQTDIHVKTIPAAEEFFQALKGVEDPEKKREIVGRLFIQIFEREAMKAGHFQFLAQGTIYPDVVESRGKERLRSDKIKTHHNVGGLPDRLPFQLIEPLRYLFKDEVRRLGVLLGVPQSILQRQPFPGPGLAVRILGEITEERVALLQKADAIFREELQGLSDPPSQFFAVLLPVKAVGVAGDKRSYGSVIALRAVSTQDFMTADWKAIPPELLARISRRITNEIRSVTRVVYDITSKPPATIEWE